MFKAISELNRKLQNLSLISLKELCIKHDVIISDDNLLIILKIIQDNPVGIIDSDFHEILLKSIRIQTNHEISKQFRSIVEGEYLIQELS
ncbi:MAG: DUF2624 domain-containing protein [Erysipelotrichaceae bacterium]|nr:DUF2624 domain-containing protein [Erysipelotrichaceae bacterium]